ncbi:hypothetical protein JTB14_004541 [Gonioctena quinquepunctata]|nr:hypothetical protein JTB14_004541 [Gonioctena quinquepunctata]
MKCYCHDISMRDKSPFHLGTYPIQYAQRMEVKRRLQEMLVWRVIAEQSTEYVSPLSSYFNFHLVNVCQQSTAHIGKFGFVGSIENIPDFPSKVERMFLMFCLLDYQHM